MDFSKVNLCRSLSAASCRETFAEKLRQQTFSWFSCNTDKAQCGFETRFQLWSHLDEVSKDHFCADIKFSSRVALFKTNWVHNGTSKVSGGDQKTLKLQLSLNKTRKRLNFVNPRGSVKTSIALCCLGRVIYYFWSLNPEGVGGAFSFIWIPKNILKQDLCTKKGVNFREPVKNYLADFFR